MTNAGAARRPIRSRSSAWANMLTRLLIKTSVTPNQISVASIVFAILGALLMVCSPTVAASLLAMLCIQLRLLCNLMDGMVAVEGGKSSATGILYNEFPDRIADSILLIAMGYAAGISWLGWCCALLAAFTAYIRIFGGSIGLPQDFGGLLPKQRRMAVLTISLLFNAIEIHMFMTHYCLLLAAIFIATGSLITCVTRTRAIAILLGNKI